MADLPVPDEVKKVLALQGLRELYPPQADAISAGVLEGKNLVLSSPTASGKTLVAVLCAMKHVLERGGKVLYLSPLRALAWEKYEEFQEYANLRTSRGGKIRVGVSTGDLDSKSPWLEGYDVVITTNEKCDSLLRHRSQWMSGVTLVIADEVHLIGEERGPTLEIAITRLRQMNPNIQVLALSATIKNADEVAEWLKAEVVSTVWRPTPLNEGVALGNIINFKDGQVKKLKPLNNLDPLNIAMNSVLDGGQALIFVESRRRAESMGREAANALTGTHSRKEQTDLDGLASQIEVHGERTSLTDSLSYAVAKGAAFHHAGLNTEHRRIVERAFKEGTLKILTATPTLAAGVNLPARTVVVANYKRFVAGYGMYPITVLEYKQMSGRAGRPQYDPYGEAVLIASSSDEQDMLMENYILAEPERLYSRLAQESALRGHTLAAVASDYAHTEQGLLDFFGGTFYGYHYPSASIRLIITGVLHYLLKEGMIEEKGQYTYATDFGRRVSELYIDPVSAVILRDGLRRGARDVSDFTWLHLICHLPDMRPILRPRRGDADAVEAYAEERLDEFAIPIEQGEDYIEREQFLGEVKTAWVLQDWISEKTESELLEQHGVQPGDRYAAVNNSDWLLYSAGELAELVGAEQHRLKLEHLRDRVRHGVSEKLLPLVRLKGIGRVRARVLYNSGFTSISAIKRAPLQQIVALPLIGPRVAKSIKEQVGGLVDEDEWRSLAKAETEQKALTDFVEEKRDEAQ